MNRQAGLAGWKIVALLFAAMVLIWFVAGIFGGEERKIKKQLNAAVDAVESEDAFGLLAVFSQEYQDDQGIIFPMIFKLAQTGFQRFEDIDVDLSNVAIEIDGSEAKVTLAVWGEATRAGTMGSGQLPVREAFEQSGAQINFRKIGGDWRVVSSRRIAWAASIR